MNMHNYGPFSWEYAAVTRLIQVNLVSSTVKYVSCLPWNVRPVEYVLTVTFAPKWPIEGTNVYHGSPPPSDCILFYFRFPLMWRLFDKPLLWGTGHREIAFIKAAVYV